MQGQLFSEQFTFPQYADGIGSFVWRNVDKGLALLIHDSINDIFCAVHVGFKGLLWVSL